MSDVLYCYHCDVRIETYLKTQNQDVTDWFYNSNLFSPDETVEVRCPKCKEKFFVHTYSTIGYDTMIDENSEMP